MTAAFAGTAAADGPYHTGEQIPFTADYRTEGAMLKSGPIEGTLRVGSDVARLDLESHPNAQHPIALLAADGETWSIDLEAKTFDRLGSGDWETKVFPRIISARKVDKIADGKCPFGFAKAQDCRNHGSETVAGRSVEKWTFKKRSLWLDPQLRVVLREEFKPFWKKDDKPSVSLSNVRLEDQDPTLFTIPGGLECRAGSYCKNAPVAR